jgi:hypothetical protein
MIWRTVGNQNLRTKFSLNPEISSSVKLATLCCDVTSRWFRHAIAVVANWPGVLWCVTWGLGSRHSLLKGWYCSLPVGAWPCNVFYTADNYYCTKYLTILTQSLFKEHISRCTYLTLCPLGSHLHLELFWILFFNLARWWSLTFFLLHILLLARMPPLFLIQKL